MTRNCRKRDKNKQNKEEKKDMEIAAPLPFDAGRH